MLSTGRRTARGLQGMSMATKTIRPARRAASGTAGGASGTAARKSTPRARGARAAAGAEAAEKKRSGTEQRPSADAAAITQAAPKPATAPSKAADASPAALAVDVSAPAKPATRVRWVSQTCRMTQPEYEQLSALKKRAGALARPMKRGRLLRAGLHALLCMPDDELFALLDSLPADPGD